jgi:hypothetical protein
MLAIIQRFLIGGTVPAPSSVIATSDGVIASVALASAGEWCCWRVLVTNGTWCDEATT